MKNCIKVELWKATHNLYFYVALGIGLIFMLCNVSETYTSVKNITEQTLEGQEMGIPLYRFTGCSLFLWWIAHNGVTNGSLYFYSCWPILAAMPFAWSFSQEFQSGSIVQYYCRMGKSKYFFSKFLSIFLVGGAVIALPVFLDLLINATICPAETLRFCNALTTIENNSFLPTVFFMHPWIHALVWCSIDFLWGGTAAVMCFLVGEKMRSPILVILFPFCLFYIIAIVGRTLCHIMDISLVLNPIQLAMQAPLGHNPEWLVFSFLGIFFLLSVVNGYRMVVKHDLL